MVRDSTASSSDEQMHAALPNCAGAIVGREEIVAWISALEDCGTRAVCADSRAGAAT
jgi:hypothetical protein